jgi:hypothetical protein
MNRNWTNDTRKILRDAQRNAPKELLGDIKREMARRGVRPSYGVQKSHIIGMHVRRWGAAAASVAVLVGLGISLMPRGHQADNTSAALHGQHSSSVHAVQRATAEDACRPTSAPLVAALGTVRQWVKQAHETVLHDRRMQQGLLASAPEAATNVEPAAADVPSEQQSAPAISSEDASIRTSREAGDKVMGNTKPQGKMPDEMSLLADTRDSRSVQVAAHMAGMPSSNLNGMAGGQYVKLYDATVSSPNSNGQSSTGVSGLEHAQVSGLKSKHYQPVQVGVSVRIPFGRRWSLQTGVNYAYLKSEFKDAVLPKEIVGTQHLHYIGVPVNVSYDVWDASRLNVYATTGVEVQQLVKGTYKSDAGDERVTEHRPVVSVNAAAGIAFKLSRPVSVYAEPGLSYHFKNGSGVESAYTDRPLGFSLNIGLRWSVR